MRFGAVPNRFFASVLVAVEPEVAFEPARLSIAACVEDSQFHQISNSDSFRISRVEPDGIFSTPSQRESVHRISLDASQIERAQSAGIQRIERHGSAFRAESADSNQLGACKLRTRHSAWHLGNSHSRIVFVTARRRSSPISSRYTADMSPDSGTCPMIAETATDPCTARRSSPSCRRL